MNSHAADGPWLPEVAVVVCTYMRAASLGRFLDSLRAQERRPSQLIIVDASPDDDTKASISAREDLETLAARVLYFQVTGRLRGLTRQRNFGLQWVITPRVAFFDDDIVLLPGCLAEMDRASRAHGSALVGVGAYIDNSALARRQVLQWRVRRCLGIVSSLAPGTYCRSGISVSWSFLEPGDKLVAGDWLPGGAVMWDAQHAREVCFEEAFTGYSNGEDLNFSLKMRARGRLAVAGAARVLHLSEPTSRPNAYQMGYEYLTNAYYTHRHCLSERTWRDAAWFMYAQGLDTLLYCVNLVRPAGRQLTWQYVKGRLRFFVELLFSQRSALRHP